MQGIHRSPVNSPHKGQWREALMFSSICAWINLWVSNRESGDLRRHCAHYDVIAMKQLIFCIMVVWYHLDLCCCRPAFHLQKMLHNLLIFNISYCRHTSVTIFHIAGNPIVRLRTSWRQHQCSNIPQCIVYVNQPVISWKLSGYDVQILRPPWC